jgi:hypothetical protein
MQRLFDATMDVVCWENDIWSVPKVIILLTNLFNVINILAFNKGHK